MIYADTPPIGLGLPRLAEKRSEELFINAWATAPLFHTCVPSLQWYLVHDAGVRTLVVNIDYKLCDDPSDSRDRKYGVLGGEIFSSLINVSKSGAIEIVDRALLKRVEESF